MNTGAATARQPDCFIVSRVDSSKYAVDGNIPYDKHPATILDMLYPKGMAKNDTSGKKYPGVIMFHGGGWIRTSKSTMSTFFNRYLDHGFVVCNADYRMGDPTGRFQPEAAYAPAAVEDALRAAKWFWDHADEYNVDRTRFIVTGASAGGHLALMVGLCTDKAFGPVNPTDFKIAAIVNGYGPTDVPDLLARGTSWAKQWLPESTPGRMELAKALSPISYVRKDVPPLITVQGSNDHTVPVVQNEKLVEALKAAGADATIHLVAGAGHGYQSPPTAWPDAEKTTFDWLAQHHILQP
jgi:acetyl esterase/lipase